MSAKHENVYLQLKAAGVELDAHESDLYAEATPEALAIVKASGWSWTTFQRQPDGQTWIEVPFAFYPWWQQRTSGGAS